jgi:predicted transposase YbfD/YdcC
MERFDRPRVKSLLDHFSDIEDFRASWRVAHPMPEILLLVVCATIASCDDFEDIAAWGTSHLSFLRRYLPYYHGIPCARWLNILMNRINPVLFSDCFMAWANSLGANGLRPDVPLQIALDGKTSRRSHDASTGKAALHLVSAFATHEKLVLGQEATHEKTNEIMAIPALLERLAAQNALAGALVTVDAMGCNPRVTQAIVEHDADYLVALKANQHDLLDDVKTYFADPPSPLESHTEHDKGHGRIETRTACVATDTAWLAREKFPHIATIARIDCTIEKGTAKSRETRFYISSRLMTAEALLHAVRAHWAIENSLHWVLDVTFKDDLSRVRKGHGAKNMAVVRHFAINLVRNAQDKKSIKLRRKLAGWDTKYLASLLVNLDS